jgi:hypothetical protein
MPRGLSTHKPKFVINSVDRYPRGANFFLERSGVAFGRRAFRTARMKRLALLVLLAGFGLGACERHDFEDTRRLHEHQDKH